MGVNPIGRITNYIVTDDEELYAECSVELSDGEVNIFQDEDTVVIKEEDFLELAERIKENQ